MAKFEDYIRQCKHFCHDADRLVPGVRTGAGERQVVFSGERKSALIKEEA